VRLLFDVNHPVQVHLLRPVIGHFAARGDDCRIVARDKDVTLRLLERFGLACSAPARPGRGRLGALRELLQREWSILRLARAFRPRLIVGTSVHAARVGRLTGACSVVINDDDASAVPLFARLAYPLASAIVTPACLAYERRGRRHHTYAGTQQLFYLHPDRFKPDAGVRDALGLRASESYALVRLSALQAHHDVGVRGLSESFVAQVVERLAGRVRVFVSSEKPLPPSLSALRFPLEPERLHDALAFAEFCLGDSQSLTAESAALGTPAFRLNDFVGRISYLAELERHGLAFGFRPGQEDWLLRTLLETLDRPDRRAAFQARRERWLRECGDPLPWLLGLLDRLAADGGERASEAA
jgi:predicted glycosyltransferase